MMDAEKALKEWADCPTGQAARLLECCDRTLKNMAKRGDIKFRLTTGGRYRFDVLEYLTRTGRKAA